jgi:hypothetical protein
MSLIRTESEIALTTLSEHIEEHVSRYRAEAEAGLQPELLQQLAQDWDDCHRDLTNQIRKSGVLPKAANPEHEVLTRLVDHVRAWFSDHDEQSALMERIVEREHELAVVIHEALQATAEGAPVSAVLRKALDVSVGARQRLEKKLK